MANPPNWTWWHKIHPSNKKENTSLLVRQFITNNPYRKDFSWDRVKSYPLADGIKKISFHFWNNEKEEWESSLKDIGSEKDLIRSIKVELTWIDLHGHDHEVVRSFRPLWPFFDTKKDDEEVIKALTPKNNTKNSED